MTELKRDIVKYVRDRAKSAYDKDSECKICGSTEELDFHHFYGMTELLEKWLKENGITINTVDDIMGVRDRFIEEEHTKVYDETVTLCHTHHLKLHSIYGKKPNLTTGPKQERWVQKRRKKEYGTI